VGDLNEEPDEDIREIWSCLRKEGAGLLENAATTSTEIRELVRRPAYANDYSGRDFESLLDSLFGLPGIASGMVGGLLGRNAWAFLTFGMGRTAIRPRRRNERSDTMIRTGYKPPRCPRLLRPKPDAGPNEACGPAPPATGGLQFHLRSSP